jgi:4'-phosphopantetheinyl transferase
LGERVDVWVADLAAPGDEAVARCAAMLSEEERVRAARFLFPALTRRYTVSHGMVRSVLAGYVGAAPEGLRFDTSAHGKPLLDGIAFNLSHSGERALLAVSEAGAVGVDVEARRMLTHLDGVSERIMSRGEYEHFLAADGPAAGNEVVLTVWTRKEAVLKASGEGISRPLRAIDVLTGSTAEVDGRRFELTALDVGDDYLGALAVEGSGWHLAMRTWAP